MCLCWLSYQKSDNAQVSVGFNFFNPFISRPNSIAALWVESFFKSSVILKIF